MAKSFIKKGAMKSAGSKVVGTVARGVGACGAAYISNATPLKNTMPKYHGLLFLGLGLAGEVFLEDDKLQALSQGLSTYGTLNTVSRLALPESAADFGQTAIQKDVTEQVGAVQEPLPGTPTLGLTLEDMANIADANKAADEVADKLLESNLEYAPVPDIADGIDFIDVADGLTA